MNSCIAKRFILLALASITACNSPGNGESSANSGRALINGNFAIAYVKRPTLSLGNPTDGITFHAGGDLYIRDLSAPGAEEHNITNSHTLGAGDVSDPEVSFDGKKIIFAMKGPSDATWDLWEYDIPNANLHAFMADQREADLGDDVDPAYLPDGRVVFSSTRQSRSKQLQNVAGVEPFSYVDEYEREPAIVLHTIDATGTNIRQISFNQSHDRNPTVLASGEIMFSRWDHLGARNQFSIFKTNPDGTNLFIYYGAHSPGNSFLQPRELPDGRLLSTLMPLSGTGEGGALVTIDVANYSEDDQPAPGVATGGHGQVQVTAKDIPLDRSFSQYGRFTAPYPLWDGTNRALVSWSPAHAVEQTNPLTGQPEKAEGTATYGVYMLDMDTRTMRAIVTVPENVVVTDAVALMARPTPNIVTDKVLDPLLVLDNLGILNVKSVYDTDSLERMGAAVLASDESIPLTTAPANDPRSQVADIARLKDPTRTTAAQRPARFVRVTKAVATPAGLSRETIGETEFEMQQLVGYAEVEPDGSFKLKVPADTPLSLAILDSNGRAFTPHTSWLQVRPGETRTCNGCHSPRRGSPINVDPIAGTHAELFGSNTAGTIHVHPGASVSSALHAVDPEGDPLTYSIVGAPSRGTVIITNASTGAFIYTANANAAIGLDTFTWRATDNHGNQSNVATITVTVHEPPVASSGESMAETRVRTYPTVANLLADISFQDVWGNRTNPCINIRYTGNADCVGAATPLQDLTTTAPSNGVINYIDHIQPLFSKNRGVNTCTRCHKNDDLTDPESVGLDLTTTTTGAGRYASYQALLVGRPILDANGQPTIEMVDGVPEVQRNTPLVVPGAARSSYFIEKIFEHELRADKTLTTSVNHNHSDWLNSAEKRLLTEWIDLGAQYYNDPFGPDTNGNGVKNLSEVRNAITGLDTTVFTDAVHPILVNRCAGCHQPFVIANGQSSVNTNFVGNRFILTGNAAGDLNVTIGMINDLARPANSYLLNRPASNNVSPNPIHPQTTNASGLQTPILSPDNPADATVPADYQTIYDWINAARIANGL